MIEKLLIRLPLAWVLLSNNSWAVECSAIWPDGAQTHNSGQTLKFEEGAKIINNPDLTVATGNLDDSSAQSCNTASCVASGSVAETSDHNTFPNASDVDISSNTTINPGAYGKLTIKSGNTVTLNPGDYTFKTDLIFESNTTLVISGSGTVRLLVKSSVSISQGVSINAGGTITQLLLFGRQDVSIDSDFVYKGLIYAKGDLSIGEDGTISGAVSGKSATLKKNTTVTYDASAMSGSDFGDFCSGTTATVDHYAISVSGTALTCEPITVTITGHDSSDAAVAPGSGTTIALSTSTSAGSWSNPSEGSLVDNGSGDADYSFDSSGSITLSFNHSTSGPVNFDISSPSEGSGSEDPTVTFVDTGFRFINGADDAIGSQTAAKTSSSLYLQAVTTDDNNICVGAFPNGATADIGFAAECINPSSCIASTQLSINYTAGSSSFDVQDDTATPTYTTLSNMTFGTDSKAAFTLNYPDAGQLQLHSQYEVLDGAGAGTGEFITGSSGQFVVKPAGLCVVAEDMDGAGGRSPACVAGDDSCDVYNEVDSAFNLVVSAHSWVSDSETNSDFCDNSITPNFQLNTIALSSAVVAPSGGSNGSLSVASVSIVSGGTVTQSLSHSEVGVFNFSAMPPNYLAQTLTSSASANVGRFIPDHFVIENSSIISAIGSFTYLGQEFNAQYDIRAVDSSGSTTTNYRDAGINNNFIKLDVDSTISYGAVNDPTGTATYLTARLSSAAALFSWGNGQAIMVDVPLTLDRDTGPDGPYTDVAIGLTLSDSDAVSLLISDLNLDTEAPMASDRRQLNASTTEFRYGRVFIAPVYGPEISTGAATSVPFIIQYWHATSSTFKTSADDLSSSYGTNWSWSAGSNCYDPDTSSDTLVCADTTVTIPSATVSSGQGALNISRPGKTGSLNMEVVVDAWLQHNWGRDWDNDAVTTDDINPSFQVNFGIYRGHDRIIYWREVH